MRRTRWGRILSIVSLIFVLVVWPLAAQGAAPDRWSMEEDRPTILDRMWGWISSLWESSGPGLDPTRLPVNPSAGTDPVAPEEPETGSATFSEPLAAGSLVP